jgi:hypothetical protein
LEAQLIKKGRRKMIIISDGGRIVQDTSSQKYKTQAQNTLNLTTAQAEHNAELKKALEAQKSDATQTQEQQKSEITNLSAQHELLKFQLEEQQQAKLEQTNTERSHRFTSNARFN